MIQGFRIRLQSVADYSDVLVSLQSRFPLSLEWEFTTSDWWFLYGDTLPRGQNVLVPLSDTGIFTSRRSLDHLRVSWQPEGDCRYAIADTYLASRILECECRVPRFYITS